MSTPTAGLPTAWNRAQFINAIKFAMQMGSPNQLAGANPDYNRVTFVIPQTAKAGAADFPDPGGVPYDIHAPIVTPAVDLEVTLTDVAVEWEARASATREEGVARFDRGRATLYVFGVTADGTGTSEYDQILGATHAMISGIRYNLNFEGPILSLFDVDVHRIYAEAVDEALNWER